MAGRGPQAADVYFFCLFNKPGRSLKWSPAWVWALRESSKRVVKSNYLTTLPGVQVQVQAMELTRSRGWCSQQPSARSVWINSQQLTQWNLLRTAPDKPLGGLPIGFWNISGAYFKLMIGKKLLWKPERLLLELIQVQTCHCLGEEFDCRMLLGHETTTAEG